MWRIAAISLAAAVAGACGAASVRAQGAAPPVPWVDRPAPRYELPPDRTIPHPTSAPACRAAQLDARRTRSGAAAGNLLYRFAFTNTGPRPCLAAGFPAVALREANGRRVRVKRARGGTYFGIMAPADIAPGRAAELDLATEDVTCPPSGDRPVRLLGFRVGGGSITLRGLLGGCGHWELSMLGRSQRWANEQPPRAGTPGTLAVTWSLRPSFPVRAGQTLHYIVTLRNPTRTAVRLTPCPSYTETVVPRRVFTATYYLNCSAVRVIAPGQSIHFRMRQQIPRGVSGLAKLGWHLDTPVDAGAGAAVTIG